MKAKFIIAICLLSLFVSCKTKKVLDPDSIAVSILPQKQFVSLIAGEPYQVDVLIPPGASPATYEPVPKQMVKLSESSIYFRIGHIEFEKAWMDKIKASNPEMEIVDLSEGIDLIKGIPHKHGEHFHDNGIDPHIWLSPQRVIMIGENIRDALSKHQPEAKDRFQKNFEGFKDSVNAMDQYIRHELQNVKNRNFLIFHPALAYWASDYGFKQYSIELEGKAPSPEHLKEIIDLSKKENIQVILIQKQFDIENAQAIADEIGANVIQIDPLAENWFDQMILLVSIFKEFD